MLEFRGLVCTTPSDLSVVEADPLTGRVRPEDVVSALRPSTRLVSVVLANNETGVIQPVGEVVKMVREREQGRRIFVHTDAAQVRGLVESLGVCIELSVVFRLLARSQWMPRSWEWTI